MSIVQVESGVQMSSMHKCRKTYYDESRDGNIHAISSYQYNTGYREFNKRCCATSQKNLKETMKDFSAATLEEKQRMFKKIISVLRTTTIFVGKNKVAYNLQAIIYLAKTKIMVNAKFHNARLQVNWKSLHRFIPDTAYWQIQ